MLLRTSAEIRWLLVPERQWVAELMGDPSRQGGRGVRLPSGALVVLVRKDQKQSQGDESVHKPKITRIKVIKC